MVRLLFKVDFLKSYSELDKLEIMSKQIKINQDLQLNSVCITENNLSVRSYQGLTVGRCVASLALLPGESLPASTLRREPVHLPQLLLREIDDTKVSIRLEGTPSQFFLLP